MSVRVVRWLIALLVVGLLSSSLLPVTGTRGAANVAVTLIVEATTVPGENVFVVGSTAELGSWNTANAVPLATGAGVYPRWSATISLPAGAAVEYKYIKKNGATVTFEPLGPNRAFSAPASGGVTRVEAWGSPATAAPGLSGKRALWLDRGSLAWSGVPGATYRLLSDPDGAIDLAGATFLPLAAAGSVSAAAYPKSPNASGLPRLALSPADLAHVPGLLKGEVVIASYNSGGALIDATRAQLQGVLDDVYAASARPITLGVSHAAGAPTLRVWAPTARNVTLRRYADSTTAAFASHPMAFDPTSGVWSVTGTAGWDKQFYLYDVEVYVPDLDAVVNNLVTDPYSVSLSRNSLRSQIVDLAGDASLKPAGWDSLAKPALAAPEDISVYEVHVRDFSATDGSVPAAQRGTFKAFTSLASAGMQHLLALKNAGLTHVHLLPAFDIASVNEDPAARTDPDPALLATYARDSDQQQAAVAATRASDSFNWGYDPLHYGAPEGSYSTSPDGAARILEFREMVATLNQNGLRVVMDVVYNHT
ncbi:MAG TPA: carbohydrate-binding module family 20 domain-containing protein, partial [Herpetosiphonaceae bacterium]|nr:carbohydrate-binding module family 20 domain-containing protein [Herpetosiphonaceae bacterium]